MAEKILIVDDDLDTLRLVGLLLQRKGYQIVAASHGAQALEKAHNEQPDLILLDVMMPDMDGFEVVRRLRADESTESIPIIMFTAKTQVDDKVTGFEAGADDYLTKPTHPAELIARVKAMLARSVRKRPAEAPRPVGEKGKIVGVLAAKGGLGVTTMALNLAITYQKLTNSSVTVADFRPGQGNLGLLLGYRTQDGLTPLLKKENGEISRQDVRQALINDKTGLQLLLSSYQPSDAKFVCSGDHFATIAEHLAFLARYTVLDLGNSLTASAEKVVEHCDQIVVIVEPLLNTIIQTKALLDDLSLKVLGLGRINVVLVNRRRSELMLPLRQVQDRLGHAISVIFTPVPELAVQAENQNVPLVNLQESNLVVQQYDKLAQLLLKHGQKIRA